MGNLDIANTIRIRPARITVDLEAVGRLFTAYVSALGIDLAFQDFERELSSLPGNYAPPKGEILLACGEDGAAIGCVALRPIKPDGCCEMKRLFVAPYGRGLGIGQKLVDAVLQKANDLGYHEIRLDTLSTMYKAIELYERAGFDRINAYYETPLKDTVFLARKLPL